jgi:glycosyltransferase involved in cell wall biosynthesis
MLTVCIPIYNAGNFIEQLLKSLSILKNKKNFKIVIIDNCSTDQSYNKLKKVKKFKNLKLFQNTKNLDFGGNFKKCIEKTNTKYLTFLGHDDVVSKGIESALKYCLKKKLDFLDSKLVVKNLEIKNNNKKRVSQFLKKNLRVKIDKYIFKWWMNCSASALPGWICETKFAKKISRKIPNSSKIPSIHLAYYFACNLKKKIWYFNKNICVQHLGLNLSQGANKAYTNLKVHNEWKMLIKKIKDKNKKKIAKAEYSQSLINNFAGYKVFSENLIYYVIKEAFRFDKSNTLKPFNFFQIIFFLIFPKILVKYMYFFYRKFSLG